MLFVEQFGFGDCVRCQNFGDFVFDEFFGFSWVFDLVVDCYFVVGMN